MPRLFTSLSIRAAACWPWIVAGIPPLVLLVLLVPLRVPVPSYDSWTFVEQYLRWTEGSYSWQNFFAKHGDHPSAVGKVIYFAVLHYLRGNVGILMLLNWALMLVVAACACVLSRPVWAGNRALGAVLMFCVNLTIFSAAQGGAWLWDFTYQNLIPGACLAVGVLLLSSGSLSWWRVALAGLLSVISVFSIAGGFLVGALFSILIWRGMTEKSSRHKIIAVGVWLAGTGLAAVIALKAFGHAPSTEEGLPPGLAVLFDRPLMRLHFVLILLGKVIGNGSVFEPDLSAGVLGGVLLLVFIAALAIIFRHRADQALVSSALPWIIFSLYGLISAGLISIGRMGKTGDPYEAFHNINALGVRTMSERFTNLTLFFIFGVIMLAAVAVRNVGRARLTSRWILQSTASALTMFIFIQMLNWQAGCQLMKLESMWMKQERAMLSFGSFLRLDGSKLWNRQLKYHTYDYAKSLAEKGRLCSVEFVPDNTLGSFHRVGELTKNQANFEPPVVLDNGKWSLSGTCRIPNTDFSGLPDLVVITAEASGEAEKIIGIAGPRLPETFLERQSQRRSYPDHYFGWSLEIGPQALRDASQFPQGTFMFRAYTLSYDGRELRLINGSHKVARVATETKLK